MMPNYYTQERLAQAHHLDLLRKAEHARPAEQLPQPRYDFLLLARLALSWRCVGYLWHPSARIGL